MRSFGGWLHDSWEMVLRNLIHIKRTPELLLDVTLSPIMFVLLFNFVFGGAIGGIVGAQGGEEQPWTDEAARTVSVPVSNHAGVLTRVIRQLDGAGIEVDDAGFRTPSLDEVFLTLTGHHAEDEVAS